MRYRLTVRPGRAGPFHGHCGRTDSADGVAFSDYVLIKGGVCLGIAGLEAYEGYDVASGVVRSQVRAVRIDANHAAIAVAVIRCRRSGRRAESAKITGQRHHGDGHGDDDKRNYRGWERTLFCIHVFPPRARTLAG